MILRIDDLHVSYGPVRAVEGLTMGLEQGEILTLIGANGAGKTSTLNAIMGLADGKGSVRFDDRELIGRKPHDIALSGISLVPEGGAVFNDMSVEENLLLGYQGRDLEERGKRLREGYERFPQLDNRRRQTAGTLSGGERQMLAIARALMCKPRLLLLDEPSFGLSPVMVSEVFRLIGELNEMGLTVLLVEQNAHRALQVADKAVVLESGKIAIAGTADELASNEAVVSAYLGVDV